MIHSSTKLKQNPKLIQRRISDGRASLVLEYYLGSTRRKVLDDSGNEVLYQNGAMKGRPIYRIHHIRRKEALHLYIAMAPHTPEERHRNKETLQLAERIRFEREQELLEVQFGYRLKSERENNFLEYFKKYSTKEIYTESMRKSFLYAMRRFEEYIQLSSVYNKYKSRLPFEALTCDMVLGYINYLRRKCHGEGAQKNFHRFKKVCADALEEGLIKQNPCKGLKIAYDSCAVTKEILTPQEVKRLAACRYDGEHRDIQRAFIFCCYTGLRFCDVSQLRFTNIDRESMLLRFCQKKAVGRSAHAAVSIPLNRSLLKLIGCDGSSEVQGSNNKIFKLPTAGAVRKHLSRWVKAAGIGKKITWHCSRHSFAVNLLNAGADIKTVSALMGHASIKMTEKYLHVIDSRKQSAIDSLDPINFDE